MRQRSSNQGHVLHPPHGCTRVYVLLLCQLRVSTGNSLPIYNNVLQVNNGNKKKNKWKKVYPSSFLVNTSLKKQSGIDTGKEKVFLFSYPPHHLLLPDKQWALLLWSHASIGVLNCVIWNSCECLAVVMTVGAEETWQKHRSLCVCPSRLSLHSLWGSVPSP